MVWDNNEYKLTIAYTGDDVIPKDEINAHKEEVVIINISYGFKVVPYECFRGCCSLTTIVFPDSIEQFNDNIIQVTRVATIHIPKSTNSISLLNPFDNTEFTLEKFTIDPENQHYAVVDDALYTKNMKTLIAYPGSKKQKTFVIPCTVEIISTCAIERSRELLNVVFPPSVKVVNDYFCNYMENLTTLTFLYSEHTIEEAISRVKMTLSNSFYQSSVNQEHIEWVYTPPFRPRCTKPYHIILKSYLLFITFMIL